MHLIFAAHIIIQSMNFLMVLLDPQHVIPLFEHSNYAYVANS